MRELGQSPVKAKKEVNGFIINRLQYALIMEAWRLVEVYWFASLCVYTYMCMYVHTCDAVCVCRVFLGGEGC